MYVLLLCIFMCLTSAPLNLPLYLSCISVFALVFYALLYWNLPSLSNYANLCRYHLRHYMCHLIEVPYFLPHYTIPFYIGHLYYIYSHHICPLHDPGSCNCAVFMSYTCINSTEFHLQGIAPRSQYSDPMPEAVTLQ